jgi:replicative DNA helicase
MYKIHATIAGIDQSAKRKGTLTAKDISKIRIAQNILSVNNNLFVVKHPVNSVYSITPLLSERKFDVLCIDGVYLMSTNGKASSDWQELTEVSRYLKQTANNMNISVVGVVQGSRASENGVTASGVAGSDAFLQDADILFGIEKEGVSVGHRTVGIKCVKNRNGIPGNASLSISFPVFSVWENEE